MIEVGMLADPARQILQAPEDLFLRAGAPTREDEFQAGRQRGLAPGEGLRRFDQGGDRCQTPQGPDVDEAVEALVLRRSEELRRKILRVEAVVNPRYLG